jgi:predicted secreted hydrolase
MTSESYIHLPADQYRHQEDNVPAQAEWWWHIGTLRHGDRVFGFEINAAGFAPKDSDKRFLLAYIMLTDVQSKRHYHTMNGFSWSDDWAQTDTAKPWSVNVGKAGEPGAISMSAEKNTPLTMNVQARFQDATSGSQIAFDLRFQARLPPLLVFGDGRSPPIDSHGETSLARYNFYYSFPKLDASGTLAIDGEVRQVQGTTWMDHEFGAWPKSVKWILQDITLDNGVCLSVFTGSDVEIIEHHTVRASVTVLGLDGISRFSHDALVTPLSPAWKSPSGVTYFPTVKVEIASLRAEFLVKSLIPDQEFWNSDIPGSQVYEGVAIAEGFYDGIPAHGTAWNEQHLVA